ncbi:hypothetical protein KPH14_008962 [Odynerus spinipes]|uniref:2-methoxy-6-polyprenyl-1,4-benzoquinol methylase, mitochondrial n=1 Tax=Odynerus spinipes TaxID=1348599 RepID=A0AAD9VR05_9HYME|nr:hypothetical protein KPH14_008962 [Odynerus spinipes]
MEDNEKMTHFGFQEIKESEKAKEVHAVFENVANNYDIMNDAMSLGIHRVWKDIFIQELAPTHGTRLLDCAGGTGDIAFRYLNFLKNTKNVNNVESYVTVSDINEYMLDVGKLRAERLGFTLENNYNIEWKQSNAEELDFPDESFTVYTIAFGIRNVTYIDKVLSEAYRVLKPGGRFLCLEFSHVNNDVLRWFYDQYSFQMIPVMGTLITGKWQPYQYLVESIRKFPKQEEFKHMIEMSGFRHTSYKNLSCDIRYDIIVEVYIILPSNLGEYKNEINISKPLAKLIVNQAKNHPIFRTYFIIPPAQFYHWAEVKTKILAGACVMFEYNRQVTKEARKEEARLAQLQKFTDDIQSLQKCTVQLQINIQYLQNAVEEIAKQTKTRLPEQRILIKADEEVREQKSTNVTPSTEANRTEKEVSFVQRALQSFDNKVEQNKKYLFVA